MLRIIGTCVLALAASVLSATGPTTQAAQAAAVDTATARTAAGHASTAPAAARRTDSPCHGYVYRLKKSARKNTVFMSYSIYCTRSVDFIQVRPFLREGDRWAYGKKVCRDIWVCRVRVHLRDRAGTQLYTARAVEGGDLADVAHVKDGRHLWGCSTPGGGAFAWGEPMNCRGAGHEW